MSGRWHILAHHPKWVYVGDPRSEALCGAMGYAKKAIPSYATHMVAISKGEKSAPLCKRCEKASAKAATS
jgi:hypothetical protein